MQQAARATLLHRFAYLINAINTSFSYPVVLSYPRNTFEMHEGKEHKLDIGRDILQLNINKPFFYGANELSSDYSRLIDNLDPDLLTRYNIQFILIRAKSKYFQQADRNRFVKAIEKSGMFNRIITNESGELYKMKEDIAVSRIQSFDQANSVPHDVLYSKTYFGYSFSLPKNAQRLILREPSLPYTYLIKSTEDYQNFNDQNKYLVKQSLSNSLRVVLYILKDPLKPHMNDHFSSEWEIPSVYEGGGRIVEIVYLPRVIFFLLYRFTEIMFIIKIYSKQILNK